MTNLTTIFPNGFAAATESQDLINPEESFRRHCEAAGLLIKDQIIADGEIHRVAHVSSKKGALDGWYILHTSGKVPVGIAGCWKEPVFESKWIADTGRAMSFTERFEHDKWVAEVKAKKDADRLASQAVAAERAEDEVGTYADASNDHPYLVRKHVSANGIKIDRAGRLVVPVINQAGEILSYQTIDADGNKRFLKGGKIEGGFYELRGNRKIVFIGEGFATCASIHEATGYTVLVAFDCGNLAKVAKSAKEMFPGSKIVIGADNDQFTEGNPGVTKGRAAAALVFGEIVYPSFSDSDMVDNKPTDFNDLHCLQGLDAVKEQIERVAGPMKDKLAFEFSRADSLQLTQIKWIVDDYIEADSLAQVFGDPGGGKSFVSIDIACCVATGGHAAGDVDADEGLTATWITEHLRQRVCLDVVIHDPLDLGQLQAVCPTKLKRQFVFHWPCHALDLLFDGIKALQAMQVIEVRWFVVHHVRVRKRWVHNFTKHQCRSCTALGHARVAFGELIIVCADHYF